MSNRKDPARSSRVLLPRQKLGDLWQLDHERTGKQSTLQLAGQAPVHLANPPSKRSCTLQVHWVGACELCKFIRYAPHAYCKPPGKRPCTEKLSGQASMPFAEAPFH
ncbi:hypothetical protein CRG98_006177 [Punica granatum]|uniref:Uncharacterized protein n=1 Tax=Punica granatum TaxID=22663 RepID=A0A2I0KY76_PUNGR|nr:hypothetical protein CRG98_006177 [Punica granatum]